MKAIILNSGKGKRLHPLTRFTPKALIKIGDDTLLGYQLKSLFACHIESIIITTGPFEKKIMQYIRRNHANLDVTFVKNTKYSTTNYIYSMWLIKHLVDDDTILLHGDLLFDRILLEQLIHETHTNCVLVNREIEPPDKDFKAVVMEDRVIKIGVEFTGKNAYFSVPLYKFSKENLHYWLKEIDKFIKKDCLKIYAEVALNRITSDIFLYPLYFTNELCMEIDTEEDLKVANARIHK